jgi:hypothetical protein
MSVWVFTIYRGRRLCDDREAPHEQVASHSTVAQVIQTVTQLGPHADDGGPNTVEQNSGLLGTSCG